MKSGLSKQPRKRKTDAPRDVCFFMIFSDLLMVFLF